MIKTLIIFVASASVLFAEPLTLSLSEKGGKGKLPSGLNVVSSVKGKTIVIELNDGKLKYGVHNIIIKKGDVTKKTKLFSPTRTQGQWLFAKDIPNIMRLISQSDTERQTQALEKKQQKQAEAEARAAGASDIQVSVDRDIRIATAEAREVFVEATITVEAAGRPRVAVG